MTLIYFHTPALSENCSLLSLHHLYPPSFFIDVKYHLLWPHATHHCKRYALQPQWITGEMLTLLNVQSGTTTVEVHGTLHLHLLRLSLEDETWKADMLCDSNNFLYPDTVKIHC